MNQIFRENLKYILAVLLVWAITFPYIFQNKDNILADLNLWYNRFFGYPNPRIAHQLVAKGDAILGGRSEPENNIVGKITSFFTGEENAKSTALALDLQFMEKACLYYKSKEHIESTFLELTWREKAQEWNSPLFTKTKAPNSNEVNLGPNPKDYWNSQIEPVLEALDYYKRALRFSGPEFIVPKKIERVAWAVCRPSEILLAYKMHMLETEKYVLDKMTKDNKIPSNLSDKAILAISLSTIKQGKIPEVNPNDYLESLLRQILLTGMKNFSPKEMDDVYEQILYLVGHDEREYLKFRQRRADLFFHLGSAEPIYYEKAIEEYRIASNIKVASESDTISLPALLVHEFDNILSVAKCHHKLTKDNDALRILDSLIPKLRNVDERSAGGMKKEILNDYNHTKRAVLRKLKRYEEADELPLAN